MDAGGGCNEGGKGEKGPRNWARRPSIEGQWRRRGKVYRHAALELHEMERPGGVGVDGNREGSRSIPSVTKSRGRGRGAGHTAYKSAGKTEGANAQ